MRTQAELAQKISDALDNGKPVNKFIYVELARIVAEAIRYNQELDPAMLELRDKVYKAFQENEERVRQCSNRFDWGSCYYGFILYDRHFKAIKDHEVWVRLNLKYDVRDQYEAITGGDREEKLRRLFYRLTNQRAC